jgi:hypothetical protein
MTNGFRFTVRTCAFLFLWNSMTEMTVTGHTFRYDKAGQVVYIVLFVSSPLLDLEKNIQTVIASVQHYPGVYKSGILEG